MGKGKRLILNDRIYHAGYLIYFGGDYTLAVKDYQKAINKEYTIEPVGVNTYARTHYHEEFKNVLIWFKHLYPEPGVVAHECFHALHHVLSHSGLRLSLDSDEAFTYLLEYLVQEISYFTKQKHRQSINRRSW